MLLVLQFAAFSALALYFAQWRTYMRYRNLQSWESMLARIRPDSSMSGLNTSLHSTKLPTLEVDRSRQQPHGFRGLWTLFANAGIALEMAEYAERNSALESSLVDPVLLTSLRRDAMQTRVSALIAMCQCWLPESIV
jgi:hypothetical protein